jgi:very-short-patch-repair endonuclease
MMARDPSPALWAPSPARGEGPVETAPTELLGERDATYPSPLVGEGGQRPGEGARTTTRQFAKQLRKSMTEAETKLWHALRAKRFENFKFKRQVPIGRYIADFACLSHKLIVEVDGSQHEGSQTELNRDTWLRTQGFKTLRLWNRELLLDLDGALLSVLAALENRDDKV